MKKADKEIVKAYVESSWETPKFVNWMVNKTSEYVILDNDMCILLEKPYIKTDFCFGYSLSTYDSESYDNAGRMARAAEKDAEYFISENLKNSNLEKADEYVAYQQYGKGKLSFYISKKLYDTLKVRGELWKYANCGEPYFLSDAENEKLNEAIDRANESFKKRLNTYLKKYGLSKINTWTYWQDA